MSNLKGKPPSITELNLLMYGELDPDMPNIPPEIAKEMWKACEPKFSQNRVGKVFLFGTGGDIKYEDSTKELFEKPSAYQIKPNWD